ncbi:MAG: D-alanyl-D-alanine carboxypeptidase/D-alanyl-D-alanine-endopeptidase, partial [Porphyromonas sp.]|nr:D-alanyl-D-alanine carboxypeptidase/D-alanyl-D-alanine-endopeptidase [Porphyromonas sp.]
MSLRARLFLLLSLFALTTPLYSQPYPEAIEILRRYEQRPGVRVTALVRDLQTGEPVLAHRTSEAFRPASL